MADPLLTLTPRFRQAIAAALGPQFADEDPVLRRSDRADYQANAAMALAKRAGRNPRDVAQAVVDHLDLAGIADSVTIAGPGFINVDLTDAYLSRELAAAALDDRLGVPSIGTPDVVVVDYSSPNVAKEMHVGHLRSTAIGDALVRTLDFLGEAVVPQNHLGDWGTQFGMLITHLADRGWTAHGDHTISDLNELYRRAQSEFQNDETFRERARARVVALQAGDPETLTLWRQLVEESERHFEAVYERLGVRLTRKDVAGESIYNPLLDDVAEELQRKGLARVDDGALCAFPPGFTKPDGDPLPLIIRKSDGGYGYAATDLAAIRHRVMTLRASRIAYVVDARQSQHFAMVFAVATEAGWLGEGRSAEHVAFGTILGEDGRPFKTRSGDTVKLVDLLDEAVDRAAAVVSEKNPDLDAESRARVARAVGIGAVKYADLCTDRVKDYVFDLDRMLAMDGNTGPYLQYAYARIRSIFRRGNLVLDLSDLTDVSTSHPAERALGLELLAFGGVVGVVGSTLQPHRLCTYLFTLASTFTTFYEACPVLKAEEPEVRLSRLVLCDLTARVLAAGLDLLGIETPEKM